MCMCVGGGKGGREGGRELKGKNRRGVKMGNTARCRTKILVQCSYYPTNTARGIEV